MSAAYEAIAACVSPASIEAALGRSDDARLRRLGLESLKQAVGAREGWTKAHREKLERYRSDPSPLVAGAAAAAFPP